MKRRDRRVISVARAIGNVGYQPFIEFKGS